MIRLQDTHWRKTVSMCGLWQNVCSNGRQNSKQKNNSRAHVKPSFSGHTFGAYANAHWRITVSLPYLSKEIWTKTVNKIEFFETLWFKLLINNYLNLYSNLRLHMRSHTGEHPYKWWVDLDTFKESFTEIWLLFTVRNADEHLHIQKATDHICVCTVERNHMRAIFAIKSSGTPIR